MRIVPFLIDPLRYLHLHHCRSFIRFRCQSSLHQSPIRIKVTMVKQISIDPFRLLMDQKIFGARPCPNDCSGLMVVNQPRGGSRHGHSKDTDNGIIVGGFTPPWLIWNSCCKYTSVISFRHARVGAYASSGASPGRRGPFGADATTTQEKWGRKMGKGGKRSKQNLFLHFSPHSPFLLKKFFAGS
jgi:hypothetical protein